MMVPGIFYSEEQSWFKPNMFKSISCPTVQLDFDTFHLELQNVLLLGDLLQCFNVVLVASGLHPVFYSPFCLFTSEQTVWQILCDSQAAVLCELLFHSALSCWTTMTVMNVTFNRLRMRSLELRYPAITCAKWTLYDERTTLLYLSCLHPSARQTFEYSVSVFHSISRLTHTDRLLPECCWGLCLAPEALKRPF